MYEPMTESKLLLTSPPVYEGISLDVGVVPVDLISIAIHLTFHSQIGHFGQNVAQGDFSVNTFYLCFIEDSEKKIIVKSHITARDTWLHDHKLRIDMESSS
jgi:hypothetical protein